MKKKVTHVKQSCVMELYVNEKRVDSLHKKLMGIHDKKGLRTPNLCKRLVCHISCGERRRNVTLL